jgi:hypothetical protein
MAWYDNAWLNRVPITVPAANVAGSSAMAGLPLFIQPAEIADVLAGARVDGKDILFTAADGETKLPHELLPSKQFYTRDGVWSWFGMPSAVYHNGTNERMFVGVATRFPSGSSRQKVIQYDYDTDTLTETHIGTVSNVDDHNNPAILVRDSDKRLMVFYPKYHSFDDLAYRVSTNPEDATAWGSETALDPDSTTGYGYPCPVEIVSEGKIYLFYRKLTGTDWRFIVSSDDGATWSASTGLFGGGYGGNPYRVLTSNGTRIDFLVSSEDAASTGGVAHFYYDGSDSTWKGSDGTSIGTPPFDWSELTKIYDPGSVYVWISDITYDDSGNPHATYYRYPGGTATDQDLYEAQWNGSTWTSTKICDEGTGPVPGRAIYPGVSKLDPDDETICWVAKEESGEYQIQKWQKTAGTWAKVSGPDGDVTSGSVENNWRPIVAKNCPPGTRGRLLFVSDFIYDDVVTHTTGICAYPALGSHFGKAYVRADVHGASDTTIYCYYNNPTLSAAQEDPAGVWADYLRVWHTDERYGAGPGWLVDVTGNSAPSGGSSGAVSYRDTGVDGPTNLGNALSFSGSQDVVMEATSVASFTGLTVEAWVKSNYSGTQRVVSTGFSASVADIAFWIDSTPGVQVHIVRQTDQYTFGAPVTGLTPTANTWQFLTMGWSAAGGLLARMNKTESSVVSSSTGTSLDADATGEMRIGNSLNGALAEIRIADNVYRSKDFTDTQVDNWDDGNAFFSIGAEETSESPPTITSDGGGPTASVNAAENQTAVTTVAADGDPAPTFSITGGADSAFFAINSGSGVLTFLASPDYETPLDSGANNTYVVEVTATNTEGTDSQVITVTVTDVATGAVITSDGGGASASINAAENQTAVTTVTATGTPSPTFSITGGADAARFSIVGATGVLTFSSAPNYESPTDADTNNQYVVVVTATNSEGVDSQTITVSVTNVNETPTNVAITNSTVQDGTDTTGGHSIGVLTTTDPDAGNTFTYTIQGGADQANFDIGGAGSNELLIDDGVLDAEAKDSYVVIVRSTDQGGVLFYDKTLTITVSSGGVPQGAIAASLRSSIRSACSRFSDESDT